MQSLLRVLICILLAVGTCVPAGMIACSSYYTYMYVGYKLATYLYYIDIYLKCAFS